MGDIDPLSGHIEQLQQALTVARGKASNLDSSVTVEVGTNGAIHAIELDARGEQLTAIELAPLLIDLHRQAVANAAESVREAVEQLSGDVQVRNEHRRVADTFTCPRPEESERPPSVSCTSATKSAGDSVVTPVQTRDFPTPASAVRSDGDVGPGNTWGNPNLSAPHRNGDESSLFGAAAPSPADRSRPASSASSPEQSSPTPVLPVVAPASALPETGVDRELYGTHGNPESDTVALVDEYYDRILRRDPLLESPLTYNDWWELPGP